MTMSHIPRYLVNLARHTSASLNRIVPTSLLSDFMYVSPVVSFAPIDPHNAAGACLGPNMLVWRLSLEPCCSIFWKQPPRVVGMVMMPREV